MNAYKNYYITILLNYFTRVLIFRAVTGPRNSQKHAKFARNLIKYMSIQHIWNVSRLLGLFNCRKLANLSWNFVTAMSNQRLKTNRRKLCCKKLGTSHDVKTLPWLSSRAHCCWITVKKTLKTLVNRRKSDQFLAKFAQKISPKSALFLPIVFRQNLPKNPREISAKSADFSPNMSLKFPQNLTFFRNLSEALILIANDIQ